MNEIQAAAMAESTTEREIRLEPGWKARLTDEFAKPYMAELRAFLLQRKRAGAVIYPPGPLIFNALNSRRSTRSRW